MRPQRQVEKQQTPPEGGWGIVVVIAAHLNMAFLLGLIRCGGVFYLSWKNEFNTSAKETAAVQSIMASLSSFCVIIGGLLTKRYGCRVSGIVGGVLTSFGLFCSFWVNSILQLYFTAAITGTGVGISYNSGIVAVAVYFKNKYKTANAVAFAGCGTGIMVSPPLLQLLLDNYGWRGAILITSALMANIVVICALFRPPPNRRRTNLQPTKCDKRTELKDNGETLNAENNNDDFDDVPNSREEHHELEIIVNEGGSVSIEDDIIGYVSLTDTKKSKPNIVNSLKSLLGLNILLKSYRFALLCLLQFEFSIPYMGFMQFIIPRAESIGVAPSSAAFLLSLFGIGTLLGRLGNGLLISWKISAENVIAITMSVAGVSLLVVNVDSYVVLALTSFVQGFAIGLLVAIPVVLTRRFVGLGNLAVSVGLFGLCFGVGVLSGPLMAGWLFDVTESYKTVFYVIAGLYFICAVQMQLFPLLKRLEPGLNIKPSDK